ncbi:MAG: TerB family tellurite resistance protein [Myxococcota bacterium]|nr:TerB family tellurite resistance protein [Myxococcota bacterium]
MSLLRRILGLAEAGPEGPGDTETVRRIAGQLERLPPDKARYLASFAYVLARVAHADLEIDDTEIAEMERIVRELAHLSDPEAALVVQIAKSQAQHLGGTENYVVTREFREVASKEQRAELLECIYAVAAADGSISAEETTEIQAIAEELGFTRPEANALRSRYRDKLSVLQDR